MPHKQFSISAFLDKVGPLQILINDSMASTARLEEVTKVSIGQPDIQVLCIPILPQTMFQHGLLCVNQN